LYAGRVGVNGERGEWIFGLCLGCIWVMSGSCLSDLYVAIGPFAGSIREFGGCSYCIIVLYMIDF
jgi:hypothetical protein